MLFYNDFLVDQHHGRAREVREPVFQALNEMNESFHHSLSRR